MGPARLGLRVAVASGDNNENNPNLQTFNPLFVRGNYFTEAGLLSPQNFFDVFPSIRIKPGLKWTAELGFDVHWRENWATEFIGSAARRFRRFPDLPRQSGLRPFRRRRAGLGHGLATDAAYYLLRCLFTFFRRAIHSSEQRRRRRLRRALDDLQILNCCL